MNEAASDTLATLMRKHIEDAARAEHLADQLKAELMAERTRRLAAEKVVDAANDPSRLERESGVVLDEVSGLAGIYRTQYPRAEKGDDHG